MERDQRELPELRSFAVSRTGVVSIQSEYEALTLMGVPPSASAAYDILTDDGMDPDKAADLSMMAYRSGRDPEAFARKIVSLRRGFRC